ncbi:MAG: signal peptidase I [Glomeribacter sp. 1016415]|nr:signal peptidase I [Glomeribacter sp. 1016415]
MNFALILFILVLVTGLAWLVEKIILLPRRRQMAKQILEEYDRQLEQFDSVTDSMTATRARLHRDALQQPWWLEYSANFFPVILVVFLLRSFVVEPFKIPSSSMLPTLLAGDFILVNKFNYGIRLPVLNKKIIENRNPERGDVVVFRYPKDESIDYIKRVIGVPGDTVAYLDKNLTINGQAVRQTPLPDYFDEERISYAKHYQQTIGNKTNAILNSPGAPSFIIGADDFPFRDHCTYSNDGVVCKVPPGHYFVMGDNRDNSADSRFWGFVPDRNLVGRAFFIWLNFSHLKRIGYFN